MELDFLKKESIDPLPTLIGKSGGETENRRPPQLSWQRPKRSRGIFPFIDPQELEERFASDRKRKPSQLGFLYEKFASPLPTRTTHLFPSPEKTIAYLQNRHATVGEVVVLGEGRFYMDGRGWGKIFFLSQYMDF
ncbi:hypothetical protein CDAR_295431 [Caerostris darwini]|uniref:Uncharacterized protein n=1 Tax=Caerostris darwini TaxID=1538125 RepID=A0AAV4QSI8_9ARAC|nr:hypothetical protein CDAR_295431 [Caerostris darwini]